MIASYARRWVTLMIGSVIGFPILLSFPVQSYAQLNLSPGLKCGAMTIGEFFVPGISYVHRNDWNKALVLGGSRWATLLAGGHYVNHDDYQDDFDEIYDEYEEDDVPHLDIRITRETFLGNTLLNMYQNLTFVTLYDLYDGQCGDNPDTFHEMTSAYQFTTLKDQPTFLAPMGVALGIVASMGESTTTYYVEEGLSREEMMAWSVAQHQLVGMGEEMLFRGVFQRSIYNHLSNHYSDDVARWGGIGLGATIFGVAHNGVGGSATPGAAFLAGLYLGWVYHPDQGDFDLPQAIAIHTWWNTIVALYSLSQSDFNEVKRSELLRVGSQAPTIPLFYYSHRF